MNPQEDLWRHLALITALVERAPAKTLGRTAIVKMAYLLQTVKGIPLGYDFRLYIYGPYDANVLYHLACAEALGAVKILPVPYPGGYGFEVRPGPEASAIQARAEDWLAQHQSAVDWVIREFGAFSAAELELLSTIIYVDREFARENRKVKWEELARRVRDVKPHFSELSVIDKTKLFLDKNLLISVNNF